MRFRTATGAAALVMHALLAVPFWWAGTADQETPKSPLSRLLEAELGRFPGIAGLYVRHLATGEEASVRGEERFESASTIKVAIMAHTATDMLLRRIGGVGPVNEFLEEQGLDALRMRHTVCSYFRISPNSTPHSSLRHAWWSPLGRSR